MSSLVDTVVISITLLRSDKYIHVCFTYILFQRLCKVKTDTLYFICFYFGLAESNGAETDSITLGKRLCTLKYQ